VTLGTLFLVAAVTQDVGAGHGGDVLALLRRQEVQRRDREAATLPAAQLAGHEVRPQSLMGFCRHLFPVHAESPGACRPAPS